MNTKFLHPKNRLAVISLILLFLLSLSSNAQASKVTVKQAVSPLKMLYSSDNISRTDDIVVTLELSGATPTKAITIKFLLDTAAMDIAKKPSLENGTVTITVGDWVAAVAAGGTLKKTLQVKTPANAVATPITQEQIARIYIQARPETYVSLRYEPEKAKEEPPAAKKDVITFDEKDLVIHPIYGKDSVKVEAFSITFLRDSKPDKGTTDKLTLKIDKKNFPFIPDILKPEVEIKDEEWKPTEKDATKYFVVKTIYLSNKSIENFKNDELAYISFEGSSSLKTIRLTDKGMFDANKPFWIEVGSNFDFADGLQANNFFGGVFLNKKDMSLGNSKVKRFGLFTGVYESKSISDSSVKYDTIQYYNEGSLALTRGDSVGTFKDAGKVTHKKVVKNISLFFSPQFRITGKPADLDGLHLFASLWVELQWQRISAEVDYSKLTRMDTIYVPRTNVSKLSYNYPDKGAEKDVRSHYFGFGAPIYFKEGDANVFFNPVIGASNQPSYNAMTNFLQSDDGKLPRLWHAFYAVQFRLHEERYGIAFTGEVRGLLIKDSPPVVSLALTKKFDLDKFIEYGKKKE